MLKYGQKNNTNYTFGITEKQIKEAKRIKKITRFCTACGTRLLENADYCSKCGSPI